MATSKIAEPEIPVFVRGTSKFASNKNVTFSTNPNENWVARYGHFYMFNAYFTLNEDYNGWSETNIIRIVGPELDSYRVSEIMVNDAVARGAYTSSTSGEVDVQLGQRITAGTRVIISGSFIAKNIG